MTPAVPGTTAVIVIVGAAPTGRTARWQTTVVTVGLQFQPSPVTTTWLTPGGSVSVTKRLVAAVGPALETSSNHVILCPASTGSGESNFLIDRSAIWPEVTVVPSVSELLAVSGSAVADETEAVLLRGPLAGAVAVIVMRGAVVTARLGRVQVRTSETGPPQIHPLPEASTFVRPAGRVSVTLIEEALFGPLLATA